MSTGSSKSREPFVPKPLKTPAPSRSACPGHSSLSYMGGCMQTRAPICVFCPWLFWHRCGSSVNDQPALFFVRAFVNALSATWHERYPLCSAPRWVMAGSEKEIAPAPSTLEKDASTYQLLLSSLTLLHLSLSFRTCVSPNLVLRLPATAGVQM